MRNHPQADFEKLMASYEGARQGDPAAREGLKSWFDACVDSMLDGKEARRQLGVLAYLMSERQATKNLAHGGRYDDLQNDPGSVASQHWERFQPFCEDILKGVEKTEDDYMARVDSLTHFVLRDLAAARNKIRDHERQFADEAQDADVAEPDEPTEDDPEQVEQRRVLLRRIFQVLSPRPFIVVILRGYCDFKWAEIADILGTTVYYAKQEFDEATRIIGEQMG